MSDANREKLLRVSGMFEGLSYAVSDAAVYGIECAVEMIEEVLESEGRCNENN